MSQVKNTDLSQSGRRPPAATITRPIRRTEPAESGGGAHPLDGAGRVGAAADKKKIVVDQN